MGDRRQSPLSRRGFPGTLGVTGVGALAGRVTISLPLARDAILAGVVPLALASLVTTVVVITAVQQFGQQPTVVER